MFQGLKFFSVVVFRDVRSARIERDETERAEGSASGPFRDFGLRLRFGGCATLFGQMVPGHQRILQIRAERGTTYAGFPHPRPTRRRKYFSPKKQTAIKLPIKRWVSFKRAFIKQTAPGSPLKMAQVDLRE